MKQRSEEWFSARVGKITGSRIGAILGLNPYQTRDDVMREMVREHHGAQKEFKGNTATQWGEEHEAQAMQDFEIMTGLTVEPVGLIEHPKYPWLAASPDGLHESGGVEIKCPYSGKIKPLPEQPHYEAQIRLCMEVTGRDSWDYYVWTEDEDYHEAVTHDPEWLQGVIEELKAFRDEYREIVNSEKLSNPYLDDKVRDLSCSEEWQAAAENYKDAKQAAEVAQKVLAQAKDELLALAKKQGTDKSQGCGVQAYKAERKGGIDYSKVPELEGVDLEQYRKKSTTYWTIK